MIIKQLIYEDFVNYKKPSMLIGMPKCSFKCDKECGSQVCQNSILAKSQDINIDIEDLINRYLSNNIISAIVIGGLEPFDSYPDLINFLHYFRHYSNDDVVIYTGYNKPEIQEQIDYIATNYNNIIVKFGRFIPNQSHYYNEVLGVELSSNNQTAEKIS